MVIFKLDKEDYQGKKFTLRYLTNGYYDIQRTSNGFEFVYTEFDDEKEMSFEDLFYNEWLEEPVAYGAFENEKLVGYVEGTIEKWNNRPVIPFINGILEYFSNLFFKFACTK